MVSFKIVAGTLRRAQTPKPATWGEMKIAQFRMKSSVSAQQDRAMKGAVRAGRTVHSSPGKEAFRPGET